MIEHKTFQILDCTIRDGGYLNDWNFDKPLVRELYRNLSRTGIDFIEIGFRNRQPANKGIWCSTPEELVREICTGISGVGVALLVDLGKVDLKLVPLAGESHVRLYRVACNKTQVTEAITLCDAIKAKGYLVSLNLMGIANYSSQEFDEAIVHIKASSVDYVYFADSYGSMFPYAMKGYIDALKQTGKKIGFHAHNNLQLAFANTLEALRHGIDIVDGTVYGMGRGAGNLPLEVLLTYLERVKGHNKYNALPVLDLVDRYFMKIHQEVKWGYNLPYMLSGSNSVHPNYAKYMLDHYYYTVEDMTKVLDIIKEINPIGYNEKLMTKIIQSGFLKPKKDGREEEGERDELTAIKTRRGVNYIDRHQGRDFLVLANGPSLVEYQDNIQELIDRVEPVVLGANNLEGLFIPHYHAFSNKKRFINYVSRVHESSKLLLSSEFEEDFIKDYTKREFEWLVHLNRFSKHFAIEDGIINSHCGSVSVLLVACAIVMGARRIFIAGMDGYKDKDNMLSKRIYFYDDVSREGKEFRDLQAYLELHKNNEDLLRAINGYLLDQQKEGLTIITPTSHKYFYLDIQHFSLR